MHSSKVHERWPSGQCIEAWWPLDKCWYRATVLQSVACTKKQLVLYEDGDAEELVLAEQEQQGLIRTVPEPQLNLRQNLVTVHKHLALNLANEGWHFCTRCDQTLESKHFPCPCNQPISLLSDDEEEESSQTLMWGGQILRAETPSAMNRRQCHGCFVSGGVQLGASACPNCGTDLTPRRTRIGHLMSPKAASSGASGVFTGQVLRASPIDSGQQQAPKATSEKGVKTTQCGGQSGLSVNAGRLHPEGQRGVRGAFAGVSRGVKKEAEEVEGPKTRTVRGAFGGVAKVVKKEVEESRFRMGNVLADCQRIQGAGRSSGKEYEQGAQDGAPGTETGTRVLSPSPNSALPIENRSQAASAPDYTGEAVTGSIPQIVGKVETGGTGGSSAVLDKGNEARGDERRVVRERGQAVEGGCSEEKRIVTLTELLKATAFEAPTCSEAASAALPLSNDSAPADLSPNPEDLSPKPSVNPSRTPQKASVGANLDESSPLAPFDAGHFSDERPLSNAGESAGPDNVLPEGLGERPVSDSYLGRGGSDAGAVSESLPCSGNVDIGAASTTKRPDGEACSDGFPCLRDLDTGARPDGSPCLMVSDTGAGSIRVLASVAFDAGATPEPGAVSTGGASPGTGAALGAKVVFDAEAVLGAEAVSDCEALSDAEDIPDAKANPGAGAGAGAVTNPGVMLDAAERSDAEATSDAGTVSDASCLSFASAQQDWQAGGSSPATNGDKAQECAPHLADPLVNPARQFAPETSSPASIFCLDGASAVMPVKRRSNAPGLASLVTESAPRGGGAKDGVLTPCNQNPKAGKSEILESMFGQGGSQCSSEQRPSDRTGEDVGRRASARLAGGAPKSTSLSHGLGYLGAPLAALSGLGWAPWGGESEVQFLGTAKEVEKEKARSAVAEVGSNVARQEPPEPGRTLRLWQSLKQQFYAKTAANPSSAELEKRAASCDGKRSVESLAGGPWSAKFDTCSDFSLPSDWVRDVTSPRGTDVTRGSRVWKSVGRRASRESVGATEADAAGTKAEPEQGCLQTEPEQGGKEAEGAALTKETGAFVGQSASEVETEKTRVRKEEDRLSPKIKEAPLGLAGCRPAAGAEATGLKLEPELGLQQEGEPDRTRAVGSAIQEEGTEAGRTDDEAEGVTDDMLAAALGDVDQLIAEHEQASDEFASASPQISAHFGSPLCRFPPSDALPELRLKRKRSSAPRKPPRRSPQTKQTDDEEVVEVRSPQWQDGRNSGLVSPDGSVCRGRIRRVPDVYRTSASLEFRVEDQVGLKSPLGSEATSGKKKRKGELKSPFEEEATSENRRRKGGAKVANEGVLGAVSGENGGKATLEKRKEEGVSEAVRGGEGGIAAIVKHGGKEVSKREEKTGVTIAGLACNGGDVDDGGVSGTASGTHEETATESKGVSKAMMKPAATGAPSSGADDGARLEGQKREKVGIASGGRLEGGLADVTAATGGSGKKRRTKRKRAAGAGGVVSGGSEGGLQTESMAGGASTEYGGLERGLWEGLLRGLQEREGEVTSSTDGGRNAAKTGDVWKHGEADCLGEGSPEESNRSLTDVETFDKDERRPAQGIPRGEERVAPRNGEGGCISEVSGGMEWGQKRKRARGADVGADLDGLSGCPKADGGLFVRAADLKAGQKLDGLSDCGAGIAETALSKDAEASEGGKGGEEMGGAKGGAEENEEQKGGEKGEVEQVSGVERKGERGAEAKMEAHREDRETKEERIGKRKKTEDLERKAGTAGGVADRTPSSGVDDVDWEEASLSLKPLSPPLSPFQLRLAQSPGLQSEGSPSKCLPELLPGSQLHVDPVPPDCGEQSKAGGDVMLKLMPGGLLALPRLVEESPSPLPRQTVPAGSPSVGAQTLQILPPSDNPLPAVFGDAASVAPFQIPKFGQESLPAIGSAGGVQDPDSASKEPPQSPRVAPLQTAQLLSTPPRNQGAQTAQQTAPRSCQTSTSETAHLLSTPPRNQGAPTAQETPPRSCETSTCPVDPAFGPTPESKHKRRRMSFSPAVKKRLVSLASPLSQTDADDTDAFCAPRGSPYFARKRRSENRVDENRASDSRSLQRQSEVGSVSRDSEVGASESDLSFSGGQPSWGAEGGNGERPSPQTKRAKFSLWLDEGTPTKAALVESPLELSVRDGQSVENGTDDPGKWWNELRGSEPLKAHTFGGANNRDLSEAALGDRNSPNWGPPKGDKSQLRATEWAEGDLLGENGTPGVERWLTLPEGTGFDDETGPRVDKPGAGRQLKTGVKMPGESARERGVDRLRENLSRTLERVGVKLAKADGESGAQRESQEGQAQPKPVRLGLPSGSRTRLLPGLHPESIECDSPGAKGHSWDPPNELKHARGIPHKFQPSRPFSLRVGESEVQPVKAQTGEAYRPSNSGVSRGSDGAPQPVKLSRSLRLLQAAKDIADKRAEAEKRAADNPNPSPITLPITLLNQNRGLGQFDWTGSDSPVGLRGIGERARGISGRERDISGGEKGIGRRPSLDEVTRENTRLNSFRLHFPPLPPVVRKKKRRRFVMRMKNAPCNRSGNESLNPSGNEALNSPSNGAKVGSNPSESGGNKIAKGVVSPGVSPPGEAIHTSPNFALAFPECVKSATHLPDSPLSPSPLKAIPFSLLLDLSPSPEKASSDSDDVTSGPVTSDDVTSQDNGPPRQRPSVSGGSMRKESPVLKGPAGCGSPLRTSRGSGCPKKRAGTSGGTLKGPQVSWGAAAAEPWGSEGPQALRGLQPGTTSVKGILKRRSSLSGDSGPQSRSVKSPETVSRGAEEAVSGASLEGKALEGAEVTLGAVSTPPDSQSRELNCSPEGVSKGEAHNQISSQKKAVRFADESGRGELCHYQCC
ncbi:hypothetical protein KFL_004970060 [Klebsormidium nitens]|uniref:Uncharacterized protein n=1 Tax=Klebsormidium nitens TaxID=105231 RepID=A0A1Y1II81_KLENI|nr:hypothetical protein KFL_004970060 [Klebsormidium nitens]|eukprot:GAQ89209.1 hypothetical protein KFL_004970060 [Klebsormidium nitens]